MIYLSTGGAAFSAGVLADEYIVKRGDTLSKITVTHWGLPVYGKSGNLQKLLTLNPQIANPNLVFPGQTVFLEDKPLGPGLSSGDSAQTKSGRTPASGEDSPQKANPATEAVPPRSVTPPPETYAADEFSRFTVEGVVGQSRIDAKDIVTGGRSVSGSDLSLELKTGWEQHWGNGAVSFLRARVRREDFKTTSPTASFSNHTPVEFGFEAGARLFKFGERGSLWASLGYQGEAFIRAKSATELTVDALSIPNAGLRMDFELLHSQIFRLAAEAGASYLAAASSDGYGAKSGFGWEAGMRLTHARRNHPFFGGLRVEQKRQDTTISNQTDAAVSMFFGMGFDVGEGP